MKEVLLVGITGQTGAYLAKLLIDSGYRVTGSSRDKNQARLSNLDKLGIDISDIEIISLNPSDARQVYSLLASRPFSAIVNLAGQTSVGLSLLQPAEALESISTSCLNFIEALRAFNLKTKYFNASSAECFGNTFDVEANEDTPFRPNSPYAVAKASSFQLTRLAREAYNLNAMSGILSNHESPLRGQAFVTSKMIKDLKLIKEGLLDCLTLGNVDTMRDWGFAADYALAILMMIESKDCDDYIIATGESHSLREMIEVAAEIMGFKSCPIIKQDSSLIRPLDVQVSKLNPSKINSSLGWKASIRFNELVSKLIHGVYF